MRAVYASVITRVRLWGLHQREAEVPAGMKIGVQWVHYCSLAGQGGEAEQTS